MINLFQSAKSKEENQRPTSYVEERVIDISEQLLQHPAANVYRFKAGGTVYLSFVWESDRFYSEGLKVGPSIAFLKVGIREKGKIKWVVNYPSIDYLRNPYEVIRVPKAWKIAIVRKDNE